MQATRWRLSLARGVAEWIYRGKVNGKGKGEARKAGWESSSSDPFSLALQRYADVGERKRTTEKLKWTPMGVCAAERDGISTSERSTTFATINSTVIGLDRNFRKVDVDEKRKIFRFLQNFHNFCIGHKFTEWKRKNLIPPKCSLTPTCFGASRETRRERARERDFPSQDSRESLWKNKSDIGK